MNFQNRLIINIVKFIGKNIHLLKLTTVMKCSAILDDLNALQNNKQACEHRK